MSSPSPCRQPLALHALWQIICIATRALLRWATGQLSCGVLASHRPVLYIPYASCTYGSANLIDSQSKNEEAIAAPSTRISNAIFKKKVH